MMRIICKPILLEAEDNIYEEKYINKSLLDELRKTHKRAYAFGTNKDGNETMINFGNSLMKKIIYPNK